MRHHEVRTQASSKMPTAFDFSGEWANEFASTMDIVQVQSVITGVYTSTVSSGDVPAVGQLAGYAHGDLISFVVKWDSMAITAWAGRHRLESNESVIESLWQMTSFGEEREDGFWHLINAGADRFTRVLVLSVGASDSARDAAEAVDENATS